MIYIGIFFLCLIIIVFIYELIINPIYMILGGNVDNYENIDFFMYPEIMDIKKNETFSNLNLSFVTSSLLDIREGGLLPVKVFKRKDRNIVGISCKFMDMIKNDDLVLVLKYVLILWLQKQKMKNNLIKSLLFTLNIIVLFILIFNQDSFSFFYKIALIIIYFIIIFMSFAFYRFIMIPKGIAKTMINSDLSQNELDIIFYHLNSYQTRNDKVKKEYNEDFEYIMIKKYISKKNGGKEKSNILFWMIVFFLMVIMLVIGYLSSK